MYSEPLSPWAQSLNRLKKALVVRHFAHDDPFVVAGGVLLSLFCDDVWPRRGTRKWCACWYRTDGHCGLNLFTAVLGGYIAYSMADKPGLAPEWLVLGWRWTNTTPVFLVRLWLASSQALWLICSKKIKLPDSMISLSSIFIYPLVSTFITWRRDVGDRFSYRVCDAQRWTKCSLAWRALQGKWCWAMQGDDGLWYGWPISKVATLFAQTRWTLNLGWWGGVGIAICTPPLGMALATFISPKGQTRRTRSRKAAGIMGMIGISECDPIAAADPARVLPAVVAGGIVGNVVGYVPCYQPCHGAWIVLPVVDGKIGYIVGTLAGADNSLYCDTAEKMLLKTVAIESNNRWFQSRKKGWLMCWLLLLVHLVLPIRFLRLSLWKKAAHHLGVRIKVETQGASEIGNRITQKILNGRGWWSSLTM